MDTAYQVLCWDGSVSSQFEDKSEAVNEGLRLLKDWTNKGDKIVVDGDFLFVCDDCGYRTDACCQVQEVL